MSLGRASYVSKEGMAKLLKSVEEDGMSETFSRTTQYRARKNVCATPTPHGTLLDYKKLTLIDGEEWEIAIANPFALFREQCRTSPHFCKIVVEALVRYPCTPGTPWGLVLYEDGVDPSDGLAKHHTRKVDVYYFTFLQFDYHAGSTCQEIS